jgi:hypothetical protein
MSVGTKARWSVGVVGLLIVLSCFAAPACVAHSKPHPVVRPPSTGALVYFGTSHGYELGISMPSPKIAVLYAFKQVGEESDGRSNSSSAYLQSAYAVRVKGNLLKRGRIHAVFPTLGTVSLRFKPNGKRKLRPPGYGCRGEQQVTEYGTFRGRVSLEGEGSYFDLSTRSGGGSLTQAPRAICRSEGGPGQDEDIDPRWEYVGSGFGSFIYSPGDGSTVLLYAAARSPYRTIGMRVAHRESAPAGAQVNVQVLELRHGIAIGRSAWVQSNVPGTLTSSLPGEHPAYATLKPSSPFQGEGSFLENSSTSHSWTGDLAISLPGMDVPLTGPEFETSLCVVSPLKVPAGCDFIRPKLVGSARPNVPLAWSRR